MFGFTVKGRGKHHFEALAQELMKKIPHAQKSLATRELRFRRPILKSLATILAGFAEDLHCGIGIWASLEAANRRLFGTPLPFLVEPGGSFPPDEVTLERVQYLLWVSYGQLVPDLFLSPDHPDITTMADLAAVILRSRLAGIPRNSADRLFLHQTPNTHAWDIKGKLVWLGCKSYLFQIPYARHLEANRDEENQIAVIDDFICQECTEWSGLGAIEILAGILPLNEARRADLLNWTERHQGVYKILRGNKDQIDLLSVINDRQYHVRMNLDRNPFEPGRYVFGALVPWDGEWCWSGAQLTLGAPSPAAIKDLKQRYRMMPTIHYRSDPADLKAARKVVAGRFKAFKKRHGGRDWAVFPDGRAFADDYRQGAKQQFDALPAAHRKLLKSRRDRNSFDQLELPPEITEARGGVAVYFNPEEGEESFGEFDQIAGALAKQGVNLSTVEEDFVRKLILDPNISPGFVRRVVEAHGDESILAAFGLAESRRDHALEYLLRRHKGPFFRPRYPSLSFTE